MTRTLLVKEEAKVDLEKFYEYYERQQQGLGERFLSEVEIQLSDISKHPEYYSFIDQKRMFRSIVVYKFPFVVIYKIVPDQIIIYTIHPTGKRPIKI